MTLTTHHRPWPLPERARRTLRRAARTAASLLSALAVAALYWVVLTRGGSR
ncbi:hypothetical protein ACWC10_27330 [Streptomyces sp. NPDC001595]|uniref:hypothetical protein n=1 Tax=Streptomyces sp. NPDC001532 TaxID=3154520 RepID=UPI00332A4176